MTDNINGHIKATAQRLRIHADYIQRDLSDWMDNYSDLQTNDAF